MKKILLQVIFLFVLLIPLKINAAYVKGTTLTGPDSKKIGEQFTLKYNINFSGLESGYNKNNGIWLIYYEIDYDENSLLISDYSSDNFEMQLFYEEESGKYFFISVVDDTNKIPSKYCADGSLYCSDYSASINLFVKDTKKVDSYVTIKEAIIFFLDASNDEVKKILSDENISDEGDTELLLRLYNKSTILRNGTEKTHKIKIESSNGTVVTPPKEASVKKDTSIKKATQNSSSQSKPTVSSKSSNASLKSLEVEKYKLNFRKTKKEYTIYIEEDVNSLNIKAETDDSKAIYKVTGAEDLKASNYKVSIEVTAEDGTKDSYIINVKIDGQLKKNLQEKMDQERKKDQKVEKTAGISKNTLKSIVIIIVVILIISIIIFIISKIKGRKMDKLLDQL